jgi:hypothetical protein
MSPTPDTKRLRELLAKATPGPWRAERIGEEESLVHAPESAEQLAKRRDVGHACVFCDSHHAANAELIAAAVNALPALLDEIDRLRRVAEAAREQAPALNSDLTRALRDLDEGGTP